MLPETANRTSSRRSVFKGMVNLVWVVPLVLVLGKLIKFLRYEPPARQASRIVLDVPPDLLALPAFIENAMIWLHHDVKGFYALDAVCTHLGCTVNLQPDISYLCRCHGSRFAPDGSVINGPATNPLRFLALSWSSKGQLIVDRSEEVGSTFRLAVGG